MAPCAAAGCIERLPAPVNVAAATKSALQGQRAAHVGGGKPEAQNSSGALPPRTASTHSSLSSVVRPTRRSRRFRRFHSSADITTRESRPCLVMTTGSCRALSLSAPKACWNSLAVARGVSMAKAPQRYSGPSGPLVPSCVGLLVFAEPPVNSRFIALSGYGRGPEPCAHLLRLAEA